MCLSEGNPFKTCVKPQAHNQKLNRANRYENEMVYISRFKLFRRISYGIGHFEGACHKKTRLRRLDKLLRVCRDRRGERSGHSASHRCRRNVACPRSFRWSHDKATLEKGHKKLLRSFISCSRKHLGILSQRGIGCPQAFWHSLSLSQRALGVMNLLLSCSGKM